MTTSTRVFVTGLGAVGASGMNLDAMWDALLKGDTAPSGSVPEYNPRTMLPDRKLLKAISRQDVLGIHAAKQAIEHSGMLAHMENPEQTGVYVGSPGNKYYQQYDFLPLMAKTKGDMHAFGEQLMDEVHPMWLLRILPNNVLAYTGISYGFKGANHNVVNHATGGMQALLEAYHAIQIGQVSRVVVVAYDVGTDEQAMFYYDKLGLLSPTGLNPFDVTHNGTRLAEGAAAFVLESEASASARDASRYAEIIGGFARTEGAGLFSIQDNGASLAVLLEDTLEAYNLTADSLACVVAHGNGNPTSDRTEAYAINQMQGSAHVPVTGFKWSMGHTLCASGLMDAVLTAQAMHTKTLPGLPGFTSHAPGCDALNILDKTQTLDGLKQYALLINRGFGSMNTTLVMKACD
jgi:3-oxoacyl-[acyl-carrier-protein] synthase I